MPLALQPNTKLVMIGDSITDCGRARPFGESGLDASGLGNGYVSLVNALLQSGAPDMHIRVVNVGASGNTVRDLKARWKTDVTDLQPDWLSIMIGINNVWRQSRDAAASPPPSAPSWWISRPPSTGCSSTCTP